MSPKVINLHNKKNHEVQADKYPNEMPFMERILQMDFPHHDFLEFKKYTIRQMKGDEKLIPVKNYMLAFLRGEKIYVLNHDFVYDVIEKGERKRMDIIFETFV